MQNRDKWYFAIGTGLGLAAGYFANSEKGKELQDEAMQRLQETKKSIEEGSNSIIESTNKALADIKAKGKQYLDKMEREEGEMEEDISAYIDSEMQKLKNRVERKMKNPTNSFSAS